MTTRQLLLTMAIADQVNATGHNIKWDHFEIFKCQSNQITIERQKKYCLYKILNQL